MVAEMGVCAMILTNLDSVSSACCVKGPCHDGQAHFSSSGTQVAHGSASCILWLQGYVMW